LATGGVWRGRLPFLTTNTPRYCGLRKEQPPTWPVQHGGSGAASRRTGYGIRLARPNITRPSPDTLLSQRRLYLGCDHTRAHIPLAMPPHSLSAHAYGRAGRGRWEWLASAAARSMVSARGQGVGDHACCGVSRWRKRHGVVGASVTAGTRTSCGLAAYQIKENKYSR
jgi:hypothetical protein